MVNHCANPVCHKPLHYLREGKVFLFSSKKSSSDGSIRPLEHFWLCGVCSRHWTLMLDAKEKVKLVQSKRGHLHARNLPDPAAAAS